MNISDNEAGSDVERLPALRDWNDSLLPMLPLPSDVDEYDFQKIESVHSSASSLRSLDLDNRPVNCGNRIEWMPSELSQNLPLRHERQLSIQAGPSNTTQVVSNDSDVASSTASSVTLQGDDMSQLQTDEEDDDDYDDTDERSQALREQGQEILDVISNLHKTMSQLEISIDAFFLGGKFVESPPTLLRNMCCKNNNLRNAVIRTDNKLSALNEAAAELGVTVETVNTRAKDLKTEVEDMDLRTTMGELEPYQIEYSKQKEYQILFRSPSPQESFYEYPDFYSPDLIPRKRRRSYSPERLPRQTCHCPGCRPGDASIKTGRKQ